MTQFKKFSFGLLTVKFDAMKRAMPWDDHDKANDSSSSDESSSSNPDSEAEDGPPNTKLKNSSQGVTVYSPFLFFPPSLLTFY